MAAVKQRDRHGHAIKRNGSPTYQSWQNMNRRVKTVRAYRGIRVCKRWKKFKNFLADMGIRPDDKTLDRIDNDGDYEPSNCRWATKIQQARNRRDTLMFRGRPLRDWCEKQGLNFHTVYYRINRNGWDMERALGL